MITVAWSIPVNPSPVSHKAVSPIWAPVQLLDFLKVLKFIISGSLNPEGREAMLSYSAVVTQLQKEFPNLVWRGNDQPNFFGLSKLAGYVLTSVGEVRVFAIVHQEDLEGDDLGYIELMLGYLQIGVFDSYESALATMRAIANAVVYEEPIVNVQGIRGSFSGAQEFLASLRQSGLITEGDVGTGYVWIRPVSGKMPEILNTINEFGGHVFSGLSTSEAAIYYRHHKA